MAQFGFYHGFGIQIDDGVFSVDESIGFYDFCDDAKGSVIIVIEGFNVSLEFWGFDSDRHIAPS